MPDRAQFEFEPRGLVTPPRHTTGADRYGFADHARLTTIGKISRHPRRKDSTVCTAAMILKSTHSARADCSLLEPFQRVRDEEYAFVLPSEDVYCISRARGMMRKRARGRHLLTKQSALEKKSPFPIEHDSVDSACSQSRQLSEDVKGQYLARTGKAGGREVCPADCLGIRDRSTGCSSRASRF